nr:hypothetical protein CFP56_66779 [Quercus suber]
MNSEEMKGPSCSTIAESRARAIDWKWEICWISQEEKEEYVKDPTEPGCSDDPIYAPPISTYPNDADDSFNRNSPRQPVMKLAPGQVSFLVLIPDSPGRGIIGNYGVVASHIQRETATWIHCDVPALGSDHWVMSVAGSGAMDRRIALLHGSEELRRQCLGDEDKDDSFGGNLCDEHKDDSFRNNLYDENRDDCSTFFKIYDLTEKTSVLFMEIKAFFLVETGMHWVMLVN